VRGGRGRGRCPCHVIVLKWRLPTDQFIQKNPQGPVVHRMVVSFSSDHLRGEVLVSDEMEGGGGRGVRVDRSGEGGQYLRGATKSVGEIGDR
jgi:hypothetical protein